METGPSPTPPVSLMGEPRSLPGVPKGRNHICKRDDQREENRTERINCGQAEECSRSIRQ